MYSSAWSLPETTSLVAMLSLAWFLCGLMVGRNLPKADSRRGRPAKAPRAERSPQREDGAETAELYVGNLSFDSTEKDVQKMFERFGTVVSVRLIENKFNGKSKGYGFVEMGGRDQASAAIRNLNGKEVDGRKVVVSPAKSRPRG